jgi:regulatory protein
MPFGRKSARPRAFLDEPGLYAYAVKALGRQMRTEVELRRLMRARVEPGDRGDAIVAATTARLKEYGFLNDVSFAETYARLRQQNDKFGQRRVRQDLKAKGIATPLVEQTLADRYANTSEEALAREYLSRKRLPRPESPKDTARIMRRLVAAGFSTGVIYSILRQWDVPDETLAALDNLDGESSCDPDSGQGAE